MSKPTDHSTKGSRPTVDEVRAAVAVYEQLPRPKRPPVGTVRR